MRNLPNLIQLDFEANFGTMACFLERKAAPFGSRPRQMEFKMTNAVIAADRHLTNALLTGKRQRSDSQMKKAGVWAIVPCPNVISLHVFLYGH